MGMEEHDALNKECAARQRAGPRNGSQSDGEEKEGGEQVDPESQNPGPNIRTLNLKS
jgi:hypothetical protein